MRISLLDNRLVCLLAQRRHRVVRSASRVLDEEGRLRGKRQIRLSDIAIANPSVLAIACPDDARVYYHLVVTFLRAVIDGMERGS